MVCVRPAQLSPHLQGACEADGPLGNGLAAGRVVGRDEGHRLEVRSVEGAEAEVRRYASACEMCCVCVCARRGEGATVKA